MVKPIDGWLGGAQAHRKKFGRPMVSLCYAQSLDGSLSARRGEPTALSGPLSSRLTHELRAAHDAILVGVGTVLADDPRLTVRLVQGKDPQPVIVDSRLRTPPEAYLLREHPLPTWIATLQKMDHPRAISLQESTGARLLKTPSGESGRVHLPSLLEKLGALGINSLMVEGGAGIISSFLADQLVDQICLTIAPLLIGGLQINLTEDFLSTTQTGGHPRLNEITNQPLGDDLIVWGKIVYPEP